MDGKISDEIREFVRRSCDDGYMDPKEFLAIADRVDREMVELPRDMDGVPIHVGDTVYLRKGSSGVVTRISFMNDLVSIICWVNRKNTQYMPSQLTHTAPDSLESIASGLDDMVDDMLGQDTVALDTLSVLRDFADRIRKLAKEQANE